jgi:hypothetical protein
MEPEGDSHHLVDPEVAQERGMDGGGVLGVLGAMQGPVQAGHVRKVQKVLTRRECLEELRQRRAVFDQARPGRRMGPDVLVGGVGEEALVEQPGDYRVSGLEHRGQRVDDGWR